MQRDSAISVTNLQGCLATCVSSGLSGAKNIKIQRKSSNFQVHILFQRILGQFLSCLVCKVVYIMCTDINLVPARCQIPQCRCV